MLILVIISKYKTFMNEDNYFLKKQTKILKKRKTFGDILTNEKPVPVSN